MAGLHAPRRKPVSRAIKIAVDRDEDIIVNIERQVNTRWQK
jgi:hypothetical protein